MKFYVGQWVREHKPGEAPGPWGVVMRIQGQLVKVKYPLYAREYHADNPTLEIDPRPRKV